MSDTYNLRSTSSRTAVTDEIVLEPTEPSGNPLSRRILRAKLVENPKNRDACVEMKLVYQKRHSTGSKPDGEQWSDLRKQALDQTVQMGSEISIGLDTTQTLRLKQELDALYEVARDGITYGEDRVRVLRGADGDAAAQVLEMIQASGEDLEAVLQAVDALRPGVLEGAALAQRHRKRQEQLDEFSDRLKQDNWTEGEWEEFFRLNKWIFGHGLDYRFLSEFQGQAYYGGTRVDRREGQRGDGLFVTQAQMSFTVLVEIKTPGAALVKQDTYRNQVHKMGDDVTGGVCQLQSNCRTWEVEGSRTDGNRELLEGIETCRPKGILVVGQLGQLSTANKRRTFELFRRGLHNLDIVTFDELHERAKRLLESDPEASV